MYRKNTASQFFSVAGIDATTGGIKSGVTWTVRRCIDGTFAAAGGTATEDGVTGGYKFAMTQADTNGNNISFFFTGTGAVPQMVNIVTTAADPTNATTFGLTNLDAAISSRMATFTPLTAAQIATGVWQDTTAGDFTTALSVGKSVMNGVALGTGLTVNALTTNNDKTGYGISAAAVSSIWQDTTASDFTTALSVGKSIMNGVSLGTGLTVNALTTNNDKTGYGLSSAAVTAIWQDATAGDFTAANSIGKSIMNGVSLGTGLTVASVSGAVGSVTGAVGSVTAGVTVTTNNDKTGYALTSAYDFAKGTVAMTESYATLHSAPTPIQILFENRSLLAEKSVTTTTLTTKKIDGSTTAETFTLNDATTPTSITRAS